MRTALRPWRPFGVIEPFRREMETLVDRFFGEEAGDGHPLPGIQAWTPRVDVAETDNEIVVTADLPGIDPKAVEISIQDGVLTVRGEKKEEKDDKAKNYHRVERFAGSFYRAVALPPGVDADKVSATSMNGVVTITVPKKAEVLPKRVTVTPKG